MRLDFSLQRPSHHIILDSQFDSGSAAASSAPLRKNFAGQEIENNFSVVRDHTFVSLHISRYYC